MKTKCGSCGGTGKNYGGIRCSSCKGTGFILKDKFKINIKNCIYCGGTGFLYGGMRCSVCN